MSFPILINNLPFVHQYSLKVIKQYQKLISQIRQGDILAVSQIELLKQKIKLFVKRIDQFYNSHFMDSRVAYLYSIRADLNKILFNTQNDSFIKSVNLNQSSSYQSQIKNKTVQKSIMNDETPAKLQKREDYIKIEQRRKEQQKQQVAKIFVKTKNYPLKTMKNQLQINKTAYNLPLRQKKIVSSYTNQNYQLSKQKYKQSTPKKIRTSKKTQAYMPKKHISSQLKPNVRNFSSNQKSIIKQQSAAQQVQSTFNKNSPSETQIDKQMHQLRKDQGSSSIKNLANLIFTIKMTKQQYREFIKIKQDSQKIIE